MGDKTFPTHLMGNEQIDSRVWNHFFYFLKTTSTSSSYDLSFQKTFFINGAQRERMFLVISYVVIKPEYLCSNVKEYVFCLVQFIWSLIS